jgi:tetratricopeptide (TPR) repeat protein
LERSLVEVNRLRGQGRVEEAAARCRELVEAWPDSWQARELLGDIYRQQNMLPDAMAQYREAMKRNPRRAAIEDKIARAALTMAQPDMLRAQADLLLTAPSHRSPGLAAALSVALPGLGQAYNRHYLKALALITLYTPCLLIVGLSVAARLGQPGLVHIRQLVTATGGSSLRWWAVAAVLVWLYGVADAALSAMRTSEKERESRFRRGEGQ